jgi:protein-S-isoprenylcysteine O-methyltransferase Ste14
MGSRSYPLILSEWLIVTVLVVMFQNFFLAAQLDLGVLAWLGVLPFLGGLGLNIWVAILLGWKTLVGFAELKVGGEGAAKLCTKGPFSVVRHPTYCAHILLLLGVFILTGYVGVGILTLLDFLTSYFLIVPLEERELLDRFGDEYRHYKSRVPRFFPSKGL